MKSLLAGGGTEKRDGRQSGLAKRSGLLPNENHIWRLKYVLRGSAADPSQRGSRLSGERSENGARGYKTRARGLPVTMRQYNLAW